MLPTLHYTTPPNVLEIETPFEMDLAPWRLLVDGIRGRGEREFPFPTIPGNTSLPFPFPKVGNGFFIPIPVPKSWE